MKAFDVLKILRDWSGQQQTQGLRDEDIEYFLSRDQKLTQAIHQAYDAFEALNEQDKEILKRDEWEQVSWLQQGIINFYPDETINPYVPLAAKGPWIVTTCGAVIHDNGGYGMLGLGHAPEVVLKELAKPQVMANVMTASFSQKRMVEALRREIGHRNQNQGPQLNHFIFMNSGSEAVTVAERISDAQAFQLTKPGARYEGYKVMRLALKGGFHGRTDRPAHTSDSTLSVYKKNLYSFRDDDSLFTVTMNSVDELQQAFKWAEENKVWFEVFALEPVMGEGNPGEAVSRVFYDCARQLCSQTQTLMLVDAIQASLRAQGVLSIVDYPGFEDCEAPDLETYSKALNAGQYPLSVLAVREDKKDLYVRGIYGNTMTANPRALDVGAAVLENLDGKLRENIRHKGAAFLNALRELQKKYPQLITSVKGTGLLLAAEIAPDKAKVVGTDGLEQRMRRRGIGVIHGGKNALRFTPHFNLTSDEINLIIKTMDEIFADYK